MNTADIFFMISSVGFVIIGILAIVIFVFVAKAAATLLRILTKIESDVEKIGGATKDLIDDLRHNVVYRMFFGQKRRRVREHK